MPTDQMPPPPARTTGEMPPPTTGEKGLLDTAVPYVLAGGLLGVVAVLGALGLVMLMTSGGVALVSVGLVGTAFCVWLAIQGFGTARYGLALRSGAVEHDGLGRSRLGSDDWAEFFKSLAGIVIGLLVVGVLAATVIPAAANIFLLAAIAGLVMTGFAHSDYMNEVRGVPKRAASVVGWVTAVLMGALALPLLLGAANAMRLNTKYDL